MLKKSRPIVVVLVVVLALAGVGLVACSGKGSSGTSGTPAASTPKAGIQKGPKGTSIAYGYVEKITLEGGFWGLTDKPLTDKSTPPPQLVAVLLSGKVPQTEIAKLAGSYVKVTGTVKKDTVSVRMAGLEMLVTTIEKQPTP